MAYAMGCAGADSGSGASGASSGDSVFVNSMAELRRIGTDSALDSAARASARDSILRSYGITAAGLEEMARELAADPDRALEAWREIDRIADGEQPQRGRSGAPTGP